MGHNRSCGGISLNQSDHAYSSSFRPRFRRDLYLRLWGNLSGDRVLLG